MGLITLCGELMSHYKKKIAVKVILHKIFGGWDLSYMINYLISCLSFYLTLLAWLCQIVFKHSSFVIKQGAAYLFYGTDGVELAIHHLSSWGFAQE